MIGRGAFKRYNSIPILRVSNGCDGKSENPNVMVSVP